MAHINLDTTVPGIRSLALFRPETGKPLYDLVQVLLRGNNSLTPAERELIAAYVSRLNNCTFCSESHTAAARCLSGDAEAIDIALDDPVYPNVTKKMQALLRIVRLVRHSGRDVMMSDISAARHATATDREIHDTILIAATFSLFNRYVDGLATMTPVDPATYEAMGERMAAGYSLPKKQS
jgi:uncharacterized peroxidase-related enzyme